MPDQIQDQNQSGAQVNGQPVMGGNPYDLIDNKNQDSAVVVAPVNVQTEQSVPVVQQVVENNTPVNNQVDSNIPVSVPVQNVQVQTQNTPVAQSTAPVAAPGGFTKKLISFIAKMSGQPDPETGVSKTDTVVAGAQVKAPVQNNAPVNNQVTQSAVVKNPFDAVMGGVTGFLDKVEKKVENAAGIDLDAPINKSVDPVVPVSVSPAVDANQNNVSQPTVSAPVENKEVVKEEVPATQIEKVNEVQVKQEIDPEIKQDEKETAPAVDAVKTEINSVENNIDVSVNPVAQNIQFGESEPQTNNGE